MLKCELFSSKINNAIACTCRLIHDAYVCVYLLREASPNRHDANEQITRKRCILAAIFHVLAL